MKTTQFVKALFKTRLSCLASVVLSIGALAGCATTDFQPSASYTTPSMAVRVHWSTRNEISERCGKNEKGCASAATPDQPYTQIWAQKPTSFDDDDNVCALGDVLLTLLDDAAAGTKLAQTAPSSATLLR